MAKTKRTRQDILASVIGTVHRKGLAATGLSELLALSGASSGSFYNYFDSKYALGHALIDYEWEKLEENILQPATEQGLSPIDQIFWILDAIEQQHQANPACKGCLLGNFIVDLVEQDPSFREHLTQVFSRWEETFATLLHQGQHQLKPDTPPTVLAGQIMTVIEGATLMSKLHRDRTRLHFSFDVARQLLTLALQEAPLQSV